MEKSGIEFEDEDDKRTFQKTLDSLSEKIVKKEGFQERRARRV